MGGVKLIKSYHHYEGATCVARYPMKTDRDGVWFLGPITAKRDENNNVVYRERRLKVRTPAGEQEIIEQVQEWDETKAQDICAGPFDSETQAILAIKRKLRPKRPKLTKQTGRDAFEKWNNQHLLNEAEERLERARRRVEDDDGEEEAA